MRTHLIVTLGISILAVSAAEAQPEKEPAPARGIAVDEGEMSAAELIHRWARSTGRLALLDPQIHGVRISFAESGTIDSATLLEVLDFYDIVVTETGPLINAHHRRNLATKEGPPWELVRDPKRLETLNKVVTHVVPIRYGAGQQIFATVRGLLTRDTNRIGNILYIQGPEVIVIVDLADKIRYYNAIIRELDRPPPTREITVTILELPRTRWRALRSANHGAQLRKALLDGADAEGSRVLDEATLTSVGGRFAIQRSMTLAKGDFIELSLAARPPKSKIHRESLELHLELALKSPTGQALKRQLNVPVSPQFTEPGGRVISFAGRVGTTVVIVLESR